MASPPFKLRCELRGHTEDVRSLSVTDTGDLLTGSRDKTIKLWKAAPGQLELTLDTTFVGHKDFVSALAYFPAGEQYPHGAVVSGSRDATVMVWDVSTAASLRTLTGHQYQVTAVVVTPQGDIYSASLDKTIRRWRGSQCIEVLEGHEAAVLCLLLLPNGDLISGSGDCTIKVWSGGRCTHTIPAHSDSVRGLALLPNVGVVSASHDQTLKVWTFEGECISELVGHTALVYSVACTEEGVIASGSEDNTLRLWRADGTCLQTIEHPGNLWDVAFLPGGDVVSACSDHVARVWSADPSRQAPGEVQQVYQQVLAARRDAAEASGGGGGGGSVPAGLKLEDPSALLVPGTKHGQTKFVREGGANIVYSWDAEKGEWERFGDIVGADSDNMAASGKYFNGQTWDYVFDVDWEDGAPPKKLALNRGDNPYDVADRFLAQEDLPASYREQIVQFVLQNTQGTDVMPLPPSFNPDPLTGGNAYVPGLPSTNQQQQQQQQQQGGFVDPFTGAGAYVPPAAGSSGGRGGAQPGSFSVTGGGADPFTGATAAATQHIPARAYLLYDAVPNTEAMRRKILDLSAQLAGEPSAAALALTEAEVAAGGVLDSLLESASRAPARSGKYPQEALQLLRELLGWPAPQLFPALDLARLAALDAGAAQSLAGSAGALSLDSEAGSLGRSLAVACSLETPLPPNQQTALRLACNCFLHAPLLLWIQRQGSALLDGYAGCAASPNKNVRQGLATLLVNLAVLLGKVAAEELEFKARILGLALELLSATPADDGETRYRTLVAVGTLARESGKVRGMGRDLGLLTLMQQLKAGGGKAGEAALEVERVLRL